MTVRPLAAALLAAAVLGVAACGGDDGGGAGEPTAEQAEKEKMRDAELKFAECMRDQGIDFPDPGADGGTHIRVGPGSGIDPDELEDASEACAKYRGALRPQLSEGDEAEFKEKALAHARCMREQGIDFPDPQFSAEGGASIRLGREIDPDDPDFKAAERACEKFVPKPGGER